MSYEVTSLNEIKGRRADRANYDAKTVHGIINSALMLHVGFIDDEGLPQIIPMLGLVIEDDENAREEGPYVLLHGYEKGRFIKQASSPNMRVAISATHIQGRVLGLSAQAHSINYRSAVIHGYTDTRVERNDVATKTELAGRVVNHMVPGRWDEVRWPPESDIKDVGFIRVRIESASAKIREGGPNDAKIDMDDPERRSKVWVGVMPVNDWVHGEPIPADYNQVEGGPKAYWSKS